MPQENNAETPSPAADGARRQRKARRSREESNATLAGRGTRHLLPESLRHMQELFELLPRLRLDANGDPDPQATDEAVLKRLATHAQASAAAMNLSDSSRRVQARRACSRPREIDLGVVPLRHGRDGPCEDRGAVIPGQHVDIQPATARCAVCQAAWDPAAHM